MICQGAAMPYNLEFRARAKVIRLFKIVKVEEVGDGRNTSEHCPADTIVVSSP